ncbi:hypothetical protein [Gordonia sihwensis]|uniref:hypothetical protein n=1 Tax=Gordonia sihwensis TaxID=173559 RepID=UPI0005ED7BDD|nr:hypothetical protein [Gordonia sihwensis]KJR10541.1 hypothetical protein UG54_00665 [Gordonia sihwensis]
MKIRILFGDHASAAPGTAIEVLAACDVASIDVNPEFWAERVAEETSEVDGNYHRIAEATIDVTAKDLRTILYPENITITATVDTH